MINILGQVDMSDMKENKLYKVQRERPGTLLSKGHECVLWKLCWEKHYSQRERQRQRAGSESVWVSRKSSLGGAEVMREKWQMGHKLEERGELSESLIGSGRTLAFPLSQMGSRWNMWSEGKGGMTCSMEWGASRFSVDRQKGRVSIKSLGLGPGPGSCHLFDSGWVT